MCKLIINNGFQQVSSAARSSTRTVGSKMEDLEDLVQNNTEDGDVSHEEIVQVLDDLVPEEEENDNNNVDVIPDPKRKKRDNPSPVYDFGAMKTEGGNKCQICGLEYKVSDGNTSNITRHILKKHKDTEQGRLLEVAINKRKAESEEQKKAKKQKVLEKEKGKQTQSSILTFLSKPAIDPIQKKKVDESLMKFLVVEAEPLEMIEKHGFRDLVYQLQPGYICPSRRTLTRKIKVFSEKLKEDLKKELKKDLEDVEDKVINVTSDHGTSGDKWRTHQNALTLSRCTSKFYIKTDTIDVMKCDGSQTGNVIRTAVRDALDEVGREDDWRINWTTDGEAKQKSARAKGKHREVGMETGYTGEN
jgi:hypothetical protein